uniref:Oleosin n=1 Tax=Kalanchoe fedtschenkoi TaxID=63787 RepID=A0A7N0TN24_KALFE
MEAQPQPADQPHRPPPLPITQLKYHLDQLPSHHKTRKTNGGFSFKKILVVACMLPLIATLFALAGLSLAGALVGLLITAPLLVLFSPVLVPAALALGLAVAGILSSGAIGLAAVTVLFWVYHFLRLVAVGSV